MCTVILNHFYAFKISNIYIYIHTANLKTQVYLKSYNKHLMCIVQREQHRICVMDEVIIAYSEGSSQ